MRTRLSGTRGSAYLFALMALWSVAATGSAGAASVEVAEQVGPQSTAELRFVAGPAESNALTLGQLDAGADFYEIEVRDARAALTAGAGCSGGGPPGTPATCRLHKPHPPEIVCVAKLVCNPVAGVGWSTRATIVLGDGGSSLDSSPVTGFGQVVAAGPGDDRIITGEGADTVDPGGGSDEVRTGAGRDSVIATAAPDGPDSYDLGSGGDSPVYVHELGSKGDSVDYRARKQRVLFKTDNFANDGSPGEHDNVTGAEVVRSGDGDDRLVGDEHTDVFFAGGGDDQLSGRGGNDWVGGEAGDDELAGGAGNDQLTDLGPGGNDVGKGAAGNDYIELGRGADRAIGGEGADAMQLGEGDDVGIAGGGRDDVRGSTGDDRISGGGGADRLGGGIGRDTILASLLDPRLTLALPGPAGPVDKRRDRVFCGPQTDAASVNPWDSVRGCERTLSVPALPRVRNSPPRATTPRPRTSRIVAPQAAVAELVDAQG